MTTHRSENTSPDHVSDKTRVYRKNSYNSVIKDNPVGKMGKGSEQTFLAEDTRTANKHVQSYLTP